MPVLIGLVIAAVGYVYLFDDLQSWREEVRQARIDKQIKRLERSRSRRPVDWDRVGVVCTILTVMAFVALGLVMH
jgi:hypothetical protein